MERKNYLDDLRGQPKYALMLIRNLVFYVTFGKKALCLRY